ncbi:MAG: GGDEF domain-containing protein [Clostridiales bacterium]|nr:GGDEF domain-containing protein [Clostridiales bacterium]
MKKRKLIGVIISEVEELYQNKLLNGIISQCYALNYDLAIFSTFIKDTGLPEYKIGEKNIFNLINFDHFDGILVAPITLTIKNLKEDIEQMLLKKCKCPVLFIDNQSKFYPNINTKDREATEKIVDHLIEEHGYQDIYCLAADPNIVATIERVQGYKNSLKKHNIPIDESRISYDGDFYYTGGEMLARKIAHGEIPKPDAVMCISDCMAIGLANELLNYGIRVPDDIAITGYDGIDETLVSYTSITTYLPPIVQTGINAVCELTKMMTGVETYPCKVVPGNMEIGHSCGCTGADYIKRSGILRMKDKLDDYKMFLDSYMTESLTSAIDLEDCINKFCYYLYLIKDYSDYYLCLCDNWDGSLDKYNMENPEYIKEGYTKEMRLVLACENREFVNSNFKFNTKDMIPDLWKDRDNPKAYYFTPIHFNDRCMGYSVITYGDKVLSYDITYRNWCRNIMNALEYYRVNRKLYLSSFRDVLTGLYNRNGLNQKLHNIINVAIKEKKKLLAIMADLDNLKEINDNFGHIEGDNVLTVVANAIQSCLVGNKISARIGGDEFLVIGTYDETITSPEKFIQGVNRFLAKYNKSSKKPYKIQISMGVYCEYINEDTDISEIIDHADQNMYKNKAWKKQILSRIK